MSTETASCSTTGQRQFCGRVLLVDDSSTNRMVIGCQLEGLGLVVTAVESGKQATEQVSRASYDLIFMDLLMPEMDGYQAIRHLRSEGVAVPIIAFSGKTDPEDQQVCMDLGCNGYLSKSFAEEELLSLLAEYLPAANSAGAVAAVSIDQVSAPLPKTPLSLPEILDGSWLWEVVNDECLIGEILMVFQRDSSSAKNKLEQAIAQGDVEEVFVWAHKLKGSAATLRAKPLEEVTGKLEKAAKSGDPIQLKRLYRDIEFAHAKLMDVLADPDWIMKYKPSTR